MSSYVQDNLMNGEKVLYQGKISNWAYFHILFSGVILLPVFGLGLIFLIAYWILKSTTELAVTNKRVIAKTGFITRNTVELNIKKVESIQVDQSLFGRMFNFGTIIVSGAGNPQAPIRSIFDPINFRKAVLAAQEEFDNTPPTARIE